MIRLDYAPPSICTQRIRSCWWACQAQLGFPDYSRWSTKVLVFPLNLTRFSSRRTAAVQQPLVPGRRSIRHRRPIVQWLWFLSWFAHTAVWSKKKHSIDAWPRSQNQRTRTQQMIADNAARTLSTIQSSFGTAVACSSYSSSSIDA